MMEERGSLLKVLGRGEVISLAFGSMIGWGWVILVGRWVSDAGLAGGILAFLLGGLMCVLVGLTYAELASSLPLAGGEMVYAYRGMGFSAAWITGWAITFAYLSVCTFEAVAIATALNVLLPLPMVGYLWEVGGSDVYISWVAIGVLFTLLVGYLNYKGVKMSGRFQVFATISLLVVGIIALLGGVTLGNVEYTKPLFTNISGVSAVLMMTPFMFVGFDVIPQAAEEINMPAKSLGQVLVFSIFLAVLWYVLMMVAVAFAAPAAVRDGAAIPLADAIAYAFNNTWAGKLVVVAGLFGILTSWNGFVVGGSRVIFAMGRAKMLPPVFGAIHPKYGTPHYAIGLLTILTALAPFLGRTALVWFVDAGAFGTVVAYLMVAASFVALRKKEPQLDRPYTVSGGLVVGILAVLAALFFVTLYLPTGAGALVWPQEWALVFLWVVIGAVLYVWARGSYGQVTDQEREHLVFGRKFSRPSITDSKSV